jgi:hypothetical protein
MIFLSLILFSVLWSLVGIFLWYRNHDNENIKPAKRLILLFAAGPILWAFLILFGIVAKIDDAMIWFENWIQK